MLKLSHVYKTYSMGNESYQALDDVSFEIDRGSFTAIVGPSGCGKSTLLHIIGGLDRAAGGEIRFGDEDITKYSEKQMDQYRLKNIGIVFQQFNLVPHLSALENIEVPMTLAGISRSERRRRSKELLQLVGLEDRANHKPNQLSGGQKQRVAIARALALNPTIVLADEPTGALDSQNGKMILELLKQISRVKGTTIVMVTHAADIAAEADHVITMLDGRVVKETFEKKSDSSGTAAEDKRWNGMRLRTAVRHALGNLLLKKWRTALVCLGSSIGICGIALMVGMGLGLETKIKKELSPILDLTSISVSVGEDKDLLTKEQIEQIKSIPGVKAAYYSYAFDAGIIHGSYNTTARIYSSKPNEWIGKKERNQMVAGDYPKSDSEIVIPESLAEELLAEGQDPTELIGSKVTVYFANSGNFASETEKADMTVSGIISEHLFGLLTESYIEHSYAEALSARIDVQKQPRPIGTSVLAESEEVVDEVKDSLVAKSFNAVTEEEQFQSVTQYFRFVQGVLGMFAGISLVVSSIMIGIVLYISVLERTKEIGVFRAMGSRRKDIRRIFFTEAGVIGFAAGGFGVVIALLLGIIGDAVIEQAILKENAFRVFSIQPGLILFCLLFSIGLSLLAGWIPSRRASSLDPVEALRHE
ncbi:ABC transporter ATP-binding protein/permease [Paenibacillus xylaniclasticus]|uniref:ABC transporter ATP-binding protein/permease n=1 Tax=Paenibacillus xylaniclasticus TaxID=588083 RepID=UPI000FD9CD25|nr:MULTISPECIES: ABC transporter ATP-binding protein/permease [Paenibacillus]GFN32738.1 ABC transporter ATP-binding protein [Paenibacillus curdlanolyticus]